MRTRPAIALLGAWGLFGGNACTGTIGALSQDEPRPPRSTRSTDTSGTTPGNPAAAGEGMTGVAGSGSSAIGNPGSPIDPSVNPEPGSGDPGSTGVPPSFTCA